MAPKACWASCRAGQPHGISSVQPGTDPSEPVVTVEADRTFFDLVEFEAETEARLHHGVSATSAGVPGAHSREVLAAASPLQAKIKNRARPGVGYGIQTS
jgi:hypothetical protein